ncbi:NEW3 domain-containing protein [Chloroflexota bacterium]
MKILRMVCGICLLLTGIFMVFPAGDILAQEPTLISEEEGEADKIELTSTYTKLEEISGGTFEFEVKLTYEGEEDRFLNLEATGPKDWFIAITPSYPKDKRIKNIRLEGGRLATETIAVQASVPFYLRPEPGDYTITVSATSEEVTGSIDLTAVITAKHEVSLTPVNELYNTKVTSGKDNPFYVKLTNQGTVAIDDLTFSSDKPEGWIIEYSPEEVNTLAAGKSQEININIKPPAKTISGDYAISIRAASEKATAERLQIRVTVETPTIWGWTGVGIILVVIAGLAVIIMRFSRR